MASLCVLVVRMLSTLSICSCFAVAFLLLVAYAVVVVVVGNTVNDHVFVLLLCC